MKQAIFWVNFVFWLILTLIILSILRRQNRPVETILPVIKQMIKEPEQQKKDFTKFSWLARALPEY